MNNTGFRTTDPGIGARRRIGVIDNIQQFFYSGYFGHRGLKIQVVVTLPNGMFGSVFIGTHRVSDSGLLNMIGLDNYISTLFRKFHMRIISAYNQLPALYGDVIFPQLSTIVTRHSIPHFEEDIMNLRILSVRESIKNLFALHKVTFGLIHSTRRFQLLLGGVEVSRYMVNSFSY